MKPFPNNFLDKLLFGKYQEDSINEEYRRRMDDEEQVRQEYKHGDFRLTREEVENL